MSLKRLICAIVFAGHNSCLVGQLNPFRPTGLSCTQSLSFIWPSLTNGRNGELEKEQDAGVLLWDNLPGLPTLSQMAEGILQP